MPNVIKIKRKYEIFYMYWTLTDFCNFQCNYCPSVLHSGDFAQGRKPGFPSNEDIEQFLDNLINKHLKGRKLYLVLSGGEPTLHPMYETIIERCAPHGIICTNTNGSRSVEWWKNLSILPQQVTISLHPEFSKMDKINEIARYVVEQKSELIFNLSCDPANWERTVEIYESLADDLKFYCVPKVLNHLESTRANYEYTAEQDRWIKEKIAYYNENQHRRVNIITGANVRSSWKQTWPIAYYDDGSESALPTLAQLTITKQHNYKGWNCEAGMDTFNVHFDGNVWGSVCKAIKLGRVESFEPRTEPITCEKNYCTCPGDLIIGKTRN